MDFPSRLHQLTFNSDNRRFLSGVGNGSRFAVVDFLRHGSRQYDREQYLSIFLDQFYPICPIFPITTLRKLFTDLFAPMNQYKLPNPAIHAFCCAVLSFGAKMLDDKEEAGRLYRLSRSILAREESLDTLFSFVTYLLLVIQQKRQGKCS